MDIEIVGGGFAGLAAARACTSRGLEAAAWNGKSEPGTAVHMTGGFFARPFPGSALESI
jgi:flavin-dependent dehydrogenase